MFSCAVGILFLKYQLFTISKTSIILCSTLLDRHGVWSQLQKYLQRIRLHRVSNDQGKTPGKTIVEGLTMQVEVDSIYAFLKA